MQLDRHAAVGILRTHRTPLVHHGHTVAVVKVVVAVRARDAPLENFCQLGLCHESKISGGCDIMVDVTRMTRIPRCYRPDNRWLAHESPGHKPLIVVNFSH